ncbi:Neuroguidin-B [Heracleum sosnowskyi]|uniref:Neuroguidin-B n=1 Tax=Heracleum sosnowskyi TaxID=360622 RepID=A0AAD8I433_9APIA|nr:Neuroguidin-B [Heracleum sosnowskyi]
MAGENGLERDAPRLVTVLKEMKEGLDAITNKVQALTAKVKDDQLSTVDGISYLEAKHLLLLNYCQSLVYYLLRKAKGLSIEGHPVVRSLVEIRLFLEKIRPIDKKLQYQIQKLTRTTGSEVENVGMNEKEADPTEKMEDPLMYRPNPGMLIPKVTDEDSIGVYKPPRITPAMMEEDKMTRQERNAQRKEKQTLRRSRQSDYMRDMMDDLEGRPEEVREMVGTESMEVTKFKERLEAQSRIEEELFTRAPITKMEKKKMKHMKKNRNGMQSFTESFFDEIKALPFESSTTGQNSGFENDSYRERKFNKRKRKH